MDVLRGARDDLLQVFRVVLQPRIVQLVLERDRAQLGHVRRDGRGLGAHVDLSGQVHDLLSIEEDRLVRVVRRHLRRADLGKDCRTCDPHEALLVVESEDLGADVLDARVYHVEPVLTSVDIRDDSVVHVDEGLLGSLDAQEKAIKQLSLVHLIRGQANVCFFDATALRVDLEASRHRCVHFYDDSDEIYL